MTKRRNMVITLCVLTIGVVTVSTLAIGALGYYLYSRTTSDAEIVFAATEVGAPVGDKVTKEIGPAGGVIISPDGRLTVTIPQNAVSEAIAFTIQPITNKAGGGLGLAYRLEPNGKTFATPLKISVRFDEHDLEGTAAEALSLTYQDATGAWHLQKSTKLDQAAKTLTISTSHFTDFASISRLRLSPVETTINAGAAQKIRLIECKEPGFWDKLRSRPADCSEFTAEKDRWRLRGPGKLEPVSKVMGNVMAVYQAPERKPTPNVAWVDLTVDLWIWRADTGETSTVEKTFSTKITILGWAYDVLGADGPVVYSGRICSLEEPFTITGKHPLLDYPLKFFPTSATAGTFGYNAGKGGMMMAGNGTYVVEGADTDNPQIVCNVTSTASVRMASTSGGGIAHIKLSSLRAGCSE